MKKFKVQLLRWWVKDRELTPLERNSSKVGYMGAGFLMAGHWTVEPILFISGFCCILFQVTVKKLSCTSAKRINCLDDTFF